MQPVACLFGLLINLHSLPNLQICVGILQLFLKQVPHHPVGGGWLLIKIAESKRL
ncbi:MAG: hypothetical protein Hyperionvirus18_27 [Hyperionvirus sp.]|uniref:Uncharacterized protein n=1 Tax=Hyperionvirus sp. TaxID=2487770 RepID=A0A3G5AD19_9VIRU|nr:MAG: hypothetical protein Hyperionvirus18_27 [Hyperionvirus sp.]